MAKKKCKHKNGTYLYGWYNACNDCNEFISENKAQKRKEQPVFSGLLQYFPQACKYVAWVSLQGNLQHHPDEPLHWDRAKSTDETDALARHLIDAGPNWDNIDEDGVLHIGKTAWRALAALEKVLEKHDLELPHS